MPLPRRLSQKSGGEAEKRILANRYIVDRKLGSGNYGTALLISDRRIKDDKEKYKVVKEIAIGDLQPDETLEATREAKLLRNLDHPSIVRFHDSFIDGDYFCIITEFCEGGDLDHKVNEFKKKKKFFPEAQVVEWTIQLLLALQYMHERKVLHRDLKSRNIFLKNNRVKVGDFGISRILMGTTDMASTFVGTPYYMSPEVLKHEGYNAKSDVWSVGCIMYELVSLSHAFEGESLMGVMYKIVEGSIPEWPSRYSKEVGAVCKRLLEKDPAKRPSANDALKLPYIANQMEKIKNTMIDKHNAKDHKDSINSEAQKLASTLSSQPCLEDLKAESEKKKWRNMNPRERMRIKKQIKSDDEAMRLQMATQQQLTENRRRYEQNREHNNPYETNISTTWQVSEDRRRTPSQEEYMLSSRPYTTPLPLRRDTESEESDSSDEDNEYYHTAKQHQFVPKKHASATFSPDDRPITPMKNTMVYDLRHSTLDFKDGIPDKPELAETYYSQFEDEFEGGKGVEIVVSEDESSDEEDDHSEAGDTLVAGVGEEEEEDLISCMQNALDQSDTVKSQTLVSDSDSGAFGPAMREVKIKNLKVEAIKQLGEKEFDIAYNYLKKARYDNRVETMDESDIMRGLARLVSKPNYCFEVEQLLFLEAQAKIFS